MNHPAIDALEAAIQSNVYVRGEICGPRYQRVFIAETDCSRGLEGRGDCVVSAVDDLRSRLLLRR